MITFDHDSATRARLASNCARCGVGGWHPDVAACQLQDCGLTATRIDPLGATRASGVGAEPSPLGSAPAVRSDVNSLFHSEGVTR